MPETSQVGESIKRIGEFQMRDPVSDRLQHIPSHQARCIRSEDLTIADLPSEEPSWRDILQFALSFNGYDHWGSFEQCSKVALNPDMSSVDEIRTSLFFQQRAWRHSGACSPSPQQVTYWRELLSALRGLLLQKK